MPITGTSRDFVCSRPQVTTTQSQQIHRCVFCVCIRVSLAAAFIMLPIDAAESREESLPFKASHVENLAFAKYVGPGVYREDGNVAHKSLGKRSVAAVEDQCTQRYGCLNCSWARVCAPTSDDTLVDVSCSACSNDRPFCDIQSGSCVADTSSLCMQPSNVTCFKKEGNFPHTTDCRKFVYCSNYTSFLFKCIGTYYYNPASSKGDSYSCFTVSCSGNEGRKINHPSLNVYFAYCSSGTPVGFDRCYGNDALNTTSQFCEPNCVNEGLIADTLNCTKYYKCSYEWVANNRFMVRKHHDWQTGYSFKSEEFQCAQGIPQTGCVQSY